MSVELFLRVPYLNFTFSMLLQKTVKIMYWRHHSRLLSSAVEAFYTRFTSSVMICEQFFLPSLNSTNPEPEVLVATWRR
jgi:hypothetical protein